MKSIKTGITFLLTMLNIYFLNAQTPIVGSLPGEAGVAPNGAATYSIPIWVTPGTNSVQPNLSLVYNSSTGNGILGPGWSIQGLSSISRTGKDWMHFPGQRTGMDVSVNDRYLLDGNLLFATNNGTYHQGGTEYISEVQTFSKITSVGNTGAGPDHFIVNTKDGIELEYGNTIDSKVELPNAITALMWQLNKTTDPNGNYMTYTYNENNGESTIQKIDYTFNSLQNITSYASIEFEYVNRVFPQQFFISNVMIVQTQILSKIKVKYLNTEIRRYEFIYDNNAYPQRLKEIKYFGSNNEELKSTEIEWGVATQNFTTQGIGVPNNQYQANYFTWFKGDFNGDGIDDLISILQNTNDHDANTGNDLNQDYLRLHLFDLNGYMNNVSGRGCDFDNLEERWVRVADIDGDGKDELIVIYNDAPNRRLVAYSYVQGAGLMIKANNIVSNSSDMSIQSGDFNGDGKADVVLINRQHGSGQNPNSWLMNFDEYNSTFSQIAQGTMHNVDPNITFTMDFNGNGKTDILVCNDATTKIYEFDNNAVLSIIYSSGYPTKWHDVYPGDFNGDGKTDLLSWDHVSYKLSINYSTGLGFDGPHYLNFLGTFSAKPSDDAWDHNIYIADYNLDGLSDILIADQNTCGETFHFWLSRGNNNFQLEYTLNGGVKFRYDAAVVGDFDGDLNLELFTHKTNDIWYDGSCQQNSNGKEINLFRTLNCSQRSLAQKIMNGYGKETHFSYKTLSKLSEPPYLGKYEKGSGAVFPVFDYQGTMQVVNSMWESDLSGQTIINRYYFFYQGAKIHRQGRGFLCFERILTNNNNLNLSKKTEYDYDTDYYYPFITETSASSIGQNDMSSTVLTNNRQTYSNGIFWPYVSRTIANDYLTGVTKATDNNYNVDGNLESQSQKISGTPAGDITINAEYNYSHFGNPTNTIPNRMTFHKTTSVYPGNDAYIYETTFDYDGYGNLTDKMETPNQNLSQFLHTRYVYNNLCGKVNSIQVTGTNFDGIPMTTRTTSYDYGNSNFRFVNTATNPALQSNYSDYDFSTGNVLRQVNEGGLETSFLYDEFGRLTQINSPRVLATAGTSQPLMPDEIIYEWDNQGTIAGSVYKITRTGDNKPATVEYYDSFNRLLRSSVQKMENVNSIKYVCTDRQYEQGTGRLQSQSKPYYTNSSPQWLVYNYSSVDGRLMSETDQQTNNVTSYKYSGLSVETTFADGNKKTIYKDAIENVILTKENGVKMTYDYNSMFKLKRMESDYSNTNMEYDDWGNNVQLNDCDAGTSNYKYDALSQLREQEDANGVIYEMSYNLLGQVISKKELNQTAQAITNYTYINSGPGINKPATIQKGNDVIQYTYYGSTGELGDLRTTIRTNNSQSFSYNYDYYKNGNLKRKQFPSGFKVEYHYNTIGSLTEMKGDDGTSINTLWSNPTENALGQPLSFNFGQLSQNVNLQKQYTYDNNNYPTVIKTQNILSSTAIWQENYTFDAANGNLKERTSMYNLQEKFSYDNFNQLQSATGPTSFSITYGADGNINQKTGVGDYTYIANKHAIENLKNYPVPEPVSTHKQDIAYTAFNKASQITEGDYEYNIAYAADDERFKTELINTQTNTTEQIKYYAGDYEEFRDASNNVMRRLHYINSPYGLVAVVEKTGTNYDVRYVMTDYLGSICAVTDDAGTVLQQVSFDAWGRRRDPQTWALYGVTNAWPSALYFGRGYTGHEHLEKFDLINMNGRMYDPTLCRMLSVDNYNNNISSTIGMNRYAYALNNPLKYTDPSGELIFTIFTAVTDFRTTVLTKGAIDPWNTKENRQKAWAEYDPTAKGAKTNNAYRIDVGLFKTDENRTFAGRALQFISRFTWELPQTIVGNLYSHGRNIGGSVDNVDYYGGATLVNNNTDRSKGRWGLTLGNYINSQNVEADPRDPLFRHEYGHTLQSRLVGSLYLTRVGIPSLLGSGLEALGWHSHDDEWNEIQANRMAHRYFNKFEPSSLDRSQGGKPWNDNEYPRKYVYDWYFFLTRPSLAHMWWLFF